MTKKIELLAPAKDLAKAKIAIMYGADAVYVGGKSFSLRSRASNFSLNDLRQLVSFAKGYDAKVYVTVNIVFHNEDFPGVKEYLCDLEYIGVDGIIVSSLGLVQIAKQAAPKLECHISTQLSTCSSGAVNTLKLWGADRVVLAREVSMKDIRSIASKTDVPLEVFIHGGMCSNYSGRCTLSNRMTNRDANRGGCAHSCRWKYRVYERNELISEEKCLLSMSSKDLRATAYIEDLVRCGVASLKIEGRMKSEYYIAQVVRTYRKMIERIYEKGSLSEEEIRYFDDELIKAENRPADDGFLSGECDNTKHLYGVNGEGVTHDYVAYVRNYDPNRNLALIEVKNRFEVGDELEVFGPHLENTLFTNAVMFDAEWKSLDVANRPAQLLYIRMPVGVQKGDMIRKVRRG